MKKLIISLLLLFSFSYADNTATENKISEYEDKAMYHQFITKEYELALGYHKEGCKLRSGVACANTASMYWNGDEKHKQNKEKTFEYNLKACELDNAYACYGTAVAYEEGWLARSDNKKAQHYYKKACSLGTTDACKKVAVSNEKYTNKSSDKKAISPLRDAKVVKAFGSYIDPVSKRKVFNKSITLKIAQGQNNKVYNVLNGKVLFVGESDMLGKVIVIAHNNKLHTIYANLARFAPTVYAGRKLKQGYVIGKVDDTLVFQAIQNSKHINPMELIEEK